MDRIDGAGAQNAPTSASQRTGLADFQTQGVNQAAIADEGDYSEPQVDDFAFGKMLAQDVEGLL